MYLFLIEQLAQSQNIGVPLTTKLINLTALADLILDLTGFFVPVFPDTVETLRNGFIRQIHRMEEVFTVEEVSFRPLLAGFKQPAVLFSFRISQEQCHFFSGFQGCQVEAFQPGRRSEQFHIQGVVLPAFQNTVLVPVPGIGVFFTPGIGQDFFHCGPDLFQPFIVAGDLPFPVGLEDAAHLSVQTSPQWFLRSP